MFMAAYNAAMGTDEEKMKRAMGVVRRGWKPVEGGRWVRKSQPSVGDVHVSSTRKKPLKKAEGYNAPESARNNAKRVLRWRDEHKDEIKGMTAVGWNRANQLASNETLSLATVKRMAQFNRHRKNAAVDPKYKDEPWRDAGHVAWLGWGGTTGIDWAKRIAESEMNKSETIIDITKTNDDEQVAYGWASVIDTANGEYLVDLQEDVIKLETLRKAAHKFMIDARNAGEMHKRVRGIGTVVESLIVTPDIRKVLGMEDGPTGWFIGMKVFEKSVWEKVKSGEYSAFSIGGKGTRTEI